MKCVYCGKEAKGTEEYIISWSALDLFLECYLTLDEIRGVVHQVDPTVKGVCAKCNNDKLEIEFDYVMIQKMLIKYAFNDLRSRSEGCSFFDDEILHFLLGENEVFVKRKCDRALRARRLRSTMLGR